MSLEADGVISIYEIETGRRVAVYEGLEVHQEITRLRATLAEWQQVGDAIMVAVRGKPGPLSDSDVIGEIGRLRDENARMRGVVLHFADRRNWISAVGDTLWFGDDDPWSIAQSALNTSDVSDGMMLLTMIENADYWMRDTADKAALDAAGGME